MSAAIDYSKVPNLEALLKQTTDEELIEKANAYKTLAPGVYRLKATKIDPQLADEKAPIPGRFEFNIRFEASDRETGKRVGSFFARLSPEKHFTEGRDGTKQLDKAAKLWGHAAKALGMEKSSLHEIIEGIANYPFEGYVSEYFKLPEGGFATPRNPDERKDLIELGATPGNSLTNLSKVK